MSKPRYLSTSDIAIDAQAIFADALSIHRNWPHVPAAQDLLAGAAALLAQATAYMAYTDVASDRTTLEPVPVMEELARQADRVGAVAQRARELNCTSPQCAEVAVRIDTFLENLRYTLELGERARVLSESADTLRALSDALRDHVTGPERTQGEPRPAGFHNVFIKQIMDDLFSVHSNIKLEMKL